MLVQAHSKGYSLMFLSNFEFDISVSNTFKKGNLDNSIHHLYLYLLVIEIIYTGGVFILFYKSYDMLVIYIISLQSSYMQS